MSQFSQPGAGGDKFSPKDHPEWANKLLLVYPDEYIQGIKNPRGGDDLDAVRGEIHFIDHVDPNTGRPLVLSNTMIFPKVMVGQTKNDIGGMVLGRLGQGPNVNGNPPWILHPYTEQDAQIADAYVQANPRQQKAAPPAQQQSNGWGAPPAADDAWAGMDAAPSQAQSAWGAPAPTPAAAPAQNGWGAPAAPAAPPLPDDLIAFLKSKGVDPVAAGMSLEKATVIAQQLS